MRCPYCSRKILFVKIRRDFKCSYCSNRIIVKNFKRALIISLILFFAVGFLTIFISFFWDITVLLLIIDMLVSCGLAILIYVAILKGQKHRYES